jgi:hypothetical protein
MEGSIVPTSGAASEPIFGWTQKAWLAVLLAALIAAILVPVSASANAMAWSPYEELLSMMMFVFVFNLPLNIGAYVFLLWLSSIEDGAKIYANRTRHMVTMTIFVAVAATFFGALIDIFLVMSYLGSDSFIGIFGLGLLCVVVSFIILGRGLQRLDQRRLAFVAVGIGLMNLASWICIFAFQVIPLVFLFLIGIIVFSVVMTALFSLWHKRGSKAQELPPDTMTFTRREWRRAGILGAIMVLIIVTVVILAQTDEPNDYVGITGQLYFISGESDILHGEATFMVMLANPPDPMESDVQIRLISPNESVIPLANYSVVWIHQTANDNRVQSGDHFRIEAPGVYLGGHRVTLTCVGYALSINGEIPSMN